MHDQSACEQIQSTMISIPAEILNFDSSNSLQQPCKISPSDIPVRRSTRDIKRKKFDDELLDGGGNLMAAAGLAPGVKTPTSKRSRQSVGGDRLTTSSMVTPSMASFVATPPSESPSPTFSLAQLAADLASKTCHNEHHTTALGIQSPAAQPNFLQSPVSLKNAMAGHGSEYMDAGPTTLSQYGTSTVAHISTLDDPPKTVNFQTVLPAPSVAPPKKRARQRQPRRSSSSATSTALNPAAPSLGGQNFAEAHEKAAALKDVGRWQAVDDLALIAAVMQVNDLTSVYAGVKFSCKFTLNEIQSRWYALLYDPIISQYAQEAMKQLPPDVLVAVQSNTLFSKAEEKLLYSIPSTINPVPLTIFEHLLDQNPEIFNFARTARSLMSHWQNMRDYRLLCDQKPQPLGAQNPTFSDIEDNLEDEPCTDFVGENFVDRDLIVSEKILTKQIKKLEKELPNWHVLVESMTGLPCVDLDSNSLAALRGRMVRYIIRTKDVTIGRNCKDTKVDVDLSLEGPAFKLSRKLGSIKLRSTGDFYLTNDGPKPIYVDGKPLLTGSKSKLNNNSVLEFSCIRLVFTVNQEIILAMKNEGTKMMIP